MKLQRICIIGDGLTGLTAALALKKLNIQIHLFGNFLNKKKINDNRVTAISPSNYDFLFKFLNPKKKNLFNAIKKVDLYHEQKNEYFNFLNFENEGKNVMYITKNNLLKKTIIQNLKKQKNLKIIKKSIKDINTTNSTISTNNSKSFYDLILLCGGRNSVLARKLMGNREIKNDKNEIALTTIVKHKSNIITSKQFFLKEGPLAILPLDKNKFSLVWSVKKNDYIIKNIKNSLKQKLKKILKLNKEIKLSKISFFPISFNLNTNFTKRNVLILGEGSYNIHPIAGQGFNLILRDISKLLDEIKHNLNLGLQLKDSSILEEFSNSRKPENLLFGLGISVINSFFMYKHISPVAKELILRDIDKFKFLKSLNLKISDKGIFK